MDRRHVLGVLSGAGAALALQKSALAVERAQQSAEGHGKDGHAQENHAVGRHDAAEQAKSSAPKMMAPVSALHAHFCGIHVAKSNPKFQLVAQHYCAPRADAKHALEMHQCLLYDSFDKNAKLLGVEYIVSNEIYQRLPTDEKRYWHPHAYEVLAGGLIAPSMSPEDEMKFMRAILTTWGKTWHTWPDPTTAVPMGEPLLMWALTGDGQEDKEVIAARDRQFGVSTAAIRERRGKALGWEVPQVPFAKSMDTVGRQWTVDGEDKPTRRP